MADTVLFVFRGDPLCFVHVLLNSLDMNEKGMDGRIVLEGESVTLVEEMAKPAHFLNALYVKAKAAGLFFGACKACATKLTAIDAIKKEGIPLVGEMSGHPSMANFMAQGIQVLTF